MKQVHITSSVGDVDLPTVTVSKSGSEEVTWHSHANKPAQIRFDSPDGSPFQKATFDVPAGGSISSGPSLSHVAHKSYKYTVVGPDGENDPVVIVDN